MSLVGLLTTNSTGETEWEGKREMVDTRFRVTCLG